MAEQRRFFDSKIQSNYASAKAYYSQRRQALERAFTANMQNNTNAIIQYIEEKAHEYENKVSEIVKQSLDKIDNNTYTVKQNLTLPETMEYRTSVENVIAALSSFKSGTVSNRNIAAALGNEFENFLAEALSLNALEAEIDETVFAAIGGALSGFTKTGATKSRSWINAGVKDIRPDLGLNMAMEIDNNNIARLVNATGPKGEKLAVELQEMFDLDNFLPDNITSNEIIQSYLKSNAYGFSAKVWSAGSMNGKEFSKSSTLQNFINNQFNKTKQANRTWESNYTARFIVYQISRDLLNIIGPMNVALITGDSFIWMDDFLTKRMFYMDMQFEAVREDSNRGEGKEGFPLVPNSSIKIRVLSNDFQQFSTGATKSGVISIRSRKIKKT